VVVAQENCERSSIVQASARPKATDELKRVPEKVARNDGVLMRLMLIRTVPGVDFQVNLADLQLLPSGGRTFHSGVAYLVVVREFVAPHLPG
jgi:hypothetical protein